MTQTVANTVASHPQRAQLVSRGEVILIALSLLVMYVPTYVTLDRMVWNIVGQGHGPVLLALTLWLAWQRWPTLGRRASAPNTLTGSVVLGVGLLAYVLGRSQDILFIEVLSQIFVLSGVLLLYAGTSGLKHMWFPLFFLLFLTPLPGSVVDSITAPLKMGVSVVTEGLLHAAGYPIGRSGVTLTIGQYRLLVADACSGINSVFALEAIGVFYMSVQQHASRARNITLALLIFPISFASNVTRVVTLVLITYYFGDEAGQGFVHGFAGILLFMVATALTIGTDSVLGLFFKNKPQIQESHES